MWPRSRERGNCGKRWTDHHADSGASMWPRSRERGNFQHRVMCFCPAQPLQCGRAHVSAETEISTRDVTCDATASMWPRSRERGNSANSVCHRCRCQRASMWPRSRERGNVQAAVNQAAVLFALQCGRAHVSAETPKRQPTALDERIASMWPRSRERGNGPALRKFLEGNLLQCGRAHVSAETRACSSTGTVIPCHASMWPRSRERGNPEF